MKQKSNEDPLELPERIFEAYRRYTNVDPEASENLKIVNI